MKAVYYHFHYHQKWGLPMPRVRQKPAYTLHKPTGQARVRINGKDHYLGPWKSPESRELYDELIEEWFAANGDVSRIALTIDDLCLLYLSYCDGYYRKDGEPTGETENIRRALRFVVAHCGHRRARDFTPATLIRVRQAMIDAGLVRKAINTHVMRIRRMFRWAVVAHGLSVKAINH